MVVATKCKHGMDARYCALCNDVVRATVQTERKQQRLDSHMLTLAEKHETRKTVTLPGLDNLFAVRSAEPPPNPDKYYCSFCGQETERIRLTFGNGKPRVRLEYEQDKGTKEVSVKKVFVAGGKVQACPDCCLEIRQPIGVSVV